ncbi:hypothetical protein BC830DRAFT_1159288 [Chytriomyces sp. MP71]|nr:hypothetical protein BC830DRAFT_1159288 [Chytriomyces sp. MP71]
MAVLLLRAPRRHLLAPLSWPAGVGAAMRAMATAAAKPALDAETLKKRDLRKKLKLLASPSASHPKRPLSAFLLFASDKRGPLAASAPAALPARDRPSFVFKELGAAWKTASVADKKKYEVLADEAKKAYGKALKQYEAKLTPEDRIVLEKRRSLQKSLNPSKRPARVSKDPDEPTRSPSGYLLFLKEKGFLSAKRVPGALNPAAVAGKEWKALTETQKKPYNDKALELKKVYEAAKAQYEKKTGKSELRKTVTKDLNKLARPPAKKSVRRAAAASKRKPVKRVATKKAVKRVVKKAAPAKKRTVAAKKKPVPAKKKVAKKMLAKK